MDSSASVRLLASDRFVSAYKRATGPLRSYINGATRDLVARVASDSRNIKRDYRRLAHLREDLLEVDVTGAARMVAKVVRGEVYLLDVGGHDTIPRYTRAKLHKDLETLSHAPPSLVPRSVDRLGTMLNVQPDGGYIVWKRELLPDWAYFLSDQQFEAAFAILNAVETSNRRSASRAYFVIGGPGTGKSSILLWLARECLDSGVNVAIRLSDPLASYFQACDPALPLDRVKTSSFDPDCDVLLLDDPEDARQITLAMEAGLRHGRVVVAAFDPSQLVDDLPDDAYREIVERYDGSEFVLTECYRQKASVGEVTAKIIHTVADSTPFKADRKVTRFRSAHARLTQLANELTFPNPGGYVKRYRPGTFEHLQRELARIASLPKWQHAPHLLVVIGNSVQITQRWHAALAVAGAQITTEEQFAAIKGLEYQHVLLVLNEQLYTVLEAGFEGSGQAAYRRWRLLRIPFSRAKDSVVLFVIPLADDQLGAQR